jgi:hypothetical protein
MMVYNQVNGDGTYNQEMWFTFIKLNWEVSYDEGVRYCINRRVCHKWYFHSDDITPFKIVLRRKYDR